MDYAVLFLLTLAFFHTEAKVFTKCELVRELRRHGFPESQLRDWVCLVQHESSFNTKAIGRMNKDGSTDYGLFQINDRYWCSSGSSPGKGCNIRCKDLLLDDIRIAAKCAKHIFGVHGFEAWVAWKTHCRGKQLPDISSC